MLNRAAALLGSIANDSLPVLQQSKFSSLYGRHPCKEKKKNEKKAHIIRGEGVEGGGGGV